ncbi:hypothetical protein K7432_001232 [Basidiobolus ranarum]|uniref:Uncharacterized protein n=1 Tax=Basidiobolus ranarum TaxID=34480 RepID=A0ABR2X3A2_9FUNG
METSRFQKHSSPRTPTKNHARRNHQAQSSPKHENTSRPRNAPQTPPKISYPKNNDYTSPQRKFLPTPHSPSTKFNGNKQSPRRILVSKEEGISPYSSDSDSFEVSTPPRNSFLSDDIYRKHKSGASPRNISRETTPDLISDEELSPRRNPNRDSKKGLYAGPTFSNAPTPDALPVPVFNGRLSSPKSPVHKSPSTSTHTYNELGLTSTYQQSTINVSPQPFVPENDLRLRSQKLLSLLNGGSNGFSSAPQVYNTAPCYYPEVRPVYDQYYPTYNLPYYQGFPPDSLGLPQTSIFVPA